MYQYPYGDSQQLNLDWLVSQWQIVKNGIDQSLQAEIDRVETAIADLLNARDQAVAAAASANNDAGDAHTDATNAHTDALAAAGDAASASADALKAEGNAVGEQNGTPVTSGSPYYQNNAKYYANEAASDASDAHNDSQAAAGNALYAEGWAVGEQNGTPVTSGSPYYENNAKYYANSIAGDAASAAADALEAEGWAVGEQNGTPVSSGSPYYENNAKYYAQQSQPRPNLIYSFTKQMVQYGSIQPNGAQDNTTFCFKTRHKIPVAAGQQAKITITPPSASNLAIYGIRVITFNYESMATSPGGTVLYNDLNKNIPITAETVIQSTGNSYLMFGFYFKDSTNTGINDILDYYSDDEILFTVEIVGEKSYYLTEEDEDYILESFKTSIAPVFSGMIAEKSLIPNDIFYIGNVLYIATTNIADRTAITIGTNATQTTLDAIIKSIR